MAAEDDQIDVIFTRELNNALSWRAFRQDGISSYLGRP
jgi:hypothetical protein